MIRMTQGFRNVSPAYAGLQRVEMPPTWRPDAQRLFTFVLFDRELSQEEMLAFFESAVGRGLPNPRPISAPLLELACLFHPVFFQNFVSGAGRIDAIGDIDRFRAGLRTPRLVRRPETSDVTTTEYYLQSLLFLAGCTLSAAIVQDRHTPGTINSKLDRLWQTAQYADRLGLHEVRALELDRFVVETSATQLGATRQLIAIKKKFASALGALTRRLAIEPKLLVQADLSSEQRDRFGFVDDIREALGTNLTAVFAYGSSVTSRSFSDYDLVVLVDDEVVALERLAGTNPSHRGLQINMSVYGRSDFWSFQSASGDNLDHNALCIYGEGEVPLKPQNDLLFRNFSFAFIRLRQLLGMAAFLVERGRHAGLEGKESLYNYFVKIPMHIMKGVLSVVGEPVAKEQLHSWMDAELGYDLTAQEALCLTGHLWEAIARAYLATYDVIGHLNDRYGLFSLDPPNDDLAASVRS